MPIAGADCALPRAGGETVVRRLKRALCSNSRSPGPPRSPPSSHLSLTLGGCESAGRAACPTPGTLAALLRPDGAHREGKRRPQAPDRILVLLAFSLLRPTIALSSSRHSTRSTFFLTLHQPLAVPVAAVRRLSPSASPLGPWPFFRLPGRPTAQLVPDHAAPYLHRPPKCRAAGRVPARVVALAVSDHAYVAAGSLVRATPRVAAC